MCHLPFPTCPDPGAPTFLPPFPPQVEVLLGEFWDPASGPIYSQQGDGARFWRLAKQFLDALRALRPDATFRVVFPDVGVAAMLKGEWTAPGVSLASLGDRAPASPDDDVVVLLGPDPQGVSAVGRLARGLGPDQALVMYNPRLASGDVGVGLNVRRMREGLLAGFTTAYHLRPIGDTGSLFKMYPGRWQVGGNLLGVDSVGVGSRVMRECRFWISDRWQPSGA